MNGLQTSREVPTSMDVVASGYRYVGERGDLGLFCVLRVRDFGSAEHFAKEKGLREVRYFWYPRSENTIPSGYTEIEGYRRFPQHLRQSVMAALRAKGNPFTSEDNERTTRIYRIGRK